MAKQHEKVPATPDKFFVFGIDDKGKPRGARFAAFNERALNFVLDLMLTGVYPASAAFASKGPPTRVAVPVTSTMATRSMCSPIPVRLRESRVCTSSIAPFTTLTAKAG